MGGWRGGGRMGMGLRGRGGRRRGGPAAGAGRVPWLGRVQAPPDLGPGCWAARLTRILGSGGGAPE